MLFKDALHEALKGHYIARDEWDKNGDYCVVMPGMNHIWRITTQPQPTAGNWLPHINDFLSEDWKCIKHSDRELSTPEEVKEDEKPKLVKTA